MKVKRLTIIVWMIILIVLTINSAWAITPPTGGVANWNLSIYNDLWFSNDLTNFGGVNSALYPSFNVSGNSSPNSTTYAATKYSGFTGGGVLDVGDKTISVWVRPTALSNWNEIIGNGFGVSGDPRGFELRTDASGQISYYSGNVGGTEYLNANAGAGTLVVNNWYHIMVVQNSSGAFIYVNNSLEASDTSPSGTEVSPSYNLIISGRPSAASTFNFVGQIDAIKLFNKSLNGTERANMFNCNRVSCAPPVVVSNSSTESTAVVKQVGSISFVGTTTIFSSSFNVTNNNTPLYGAYSFNVEANNNNEIFCELKVDGVVRANLTRSQTVGDLGIATIQFDTFLISAGNHTQSLTCERSSGVGLTTISNAVGIGHFLVDEFNNTLPYNTTNINNVAVTSGSSFTLLSSFTVVVGNQTANGNLTHNLVVDGSLAYTNFDGADVNLTAYIDINGSNGSFYPRTVLSGNTGSVSLDMILTNVTANATYTVNIYGDGVNASYDGSFTVKDLFLADNELVGGLNNTLGIIFSNDTDMRIFNVSAIGNFNHPLANSFNKVSFSVLTDADTTVTFFTKLVNGTNFTSINFTRDYTAGVIGVLTGHDIFENIPVDTNYEAELWANCGTAGVNCTIVGGSSLGYITDITPTILNAFSVSAFDSWDNSSISDFNVTDGASVTSVNGTAIFPSQQSFENLTISAINYFDATVLNHNTSNSLNISLNQSIIRFASFELITNNSLSTITLNVTDGTTWLTGNENDTFNLKAGNYNVTANKSGYYILTRSFTVTALDNLTVNITGMYDSIMNISAVDSFNGSSIDSFSVNIINSTYSYNATQATINGSSLLPVINGLNFLVTLTPDIAAYNIAIDTLTVNETLFNHTFSLAPYNSLNITFKVANGSIIQPTQINVTFISSNSSFSNTTTDGNLQVRLLSPDSYEARMSADGYLDRNYFFIVTDSSTLNVTIYLTLNVTTELQVFQIRDTSGGLVEGAVLRIEKETTDGSSLWTNYAEETSNAQGKVNTFLEKGITKWYRFSVIQDGIIRQLSPSLSYVSSKTNFISGVEETIDLVIILDEDALDDYFNNLYGVVYTLDWSGNNTIYFSFVDGQNSISGGRLLIKGKHVANNIVYETVSDVTLSGTSGNLSYTFTPINDTIYQIEAYIVYNDFDLLVATDTKSYIVNASVDKNWGLLISALLLAFMSFLTIRVSNDKKALMFSLIMTISMLLITNLFLFTNIPVTVITSLIGLVIILFARFRGGNE